MARMSALGKMTLGDAWTRLAKLPFGRRAFSQLIRLRIPYSGSIGAEVVELGDGHSVVRLQDRRAVRNHLDCIHAIALMNLGELSTGLAVFHKLDGSAKGIVTELRMQYFKKARGTITASCDVDISMAPGRRDLAVEGVLRDTAGDTVAKVFATWQIKVD